jgi:beta-N-acetylhexosaminidase
LITLRNKIGQMLILGFSGCELNDESPVSKWLSGDGLGGLILFDKDLTTGLQGKNILNPVQIKQLTQQLKNYSTASLPLFIALDYEGGAVDRLSHVESCRPTITAASQGRLSDIDFDE